MNLINFSDTCYYKNDATGSRIEAYLEPLFFRGRQFNVEKISSNEGKIESRNATEVVKKRNYLITLLKVASYVFVIPLVAALIIKAKNRLGPEFSHTHINRPAWNIEYLDNSSNPIAIKPIKKGTKNIQEDSKYSSSSPLDLRDLDDALKEFSL